MIEESIKKAAEELGCYVLCGVLATPDGVLMEYTRLIEPDSMDLMRNVGDDEFPDIPMKSLIKFYSEDSAHAFARLIKDD